MSNLALQMLSALSGLDTKAAQQEAARLSVGIERAIAAIDANQLHELVPMLLELDWDTYTAHDDSGASWNALSGDRVTLIMDDGRRIAVYDPDAFYQDSDEDFCDWCSANGLVPDLDTYLKSYLAGRIPVEPEQAGELLTLVFGIARTKITEGTFAVRVHETLEEILEELSHD